MPMPCGFVTPGDSLSAQCQTGTHRAKTGRRARNRIEAIRCCSIQRAFSFFLERGEPVLRLFISSTPTALVLLAIAATPFAQDYPARPIRMVVPLAPGGGTDIAARITGQKLSERWGQQVIVDNLAGGGSQIATGNRRAAPR